MNDHQAHNPNGGSKTKEPQKQAQEKSRSQDDDAVLADINQDAEKTKEQEKR